MADLELRKYKRNVICACSFVINALINGFMLNFGVLLPTFLEEFSAGRTLTALVGSLQFSLIFVLAPLAGSLIDNWGLRIVTIAGGFLFSVGLISASYVQTVYGLFPTFSLIFAVSCCFVFTSVSISPVKCMPLKYQGLACAVVTCGGPTGMLSFSLLLTFLLEQFRWRIMFRILAYIGIVICLLSLSYGWMGDGQETKKTPENRRMCCDVSLCKRPRFLFFVFGTAIGMFGWPIGNFFLADRAKTYGIHEDQSKWFYFVIGSFSILSALISGKIADRVNHRVLLSTVFLFLHGVNTMLSYLCKTYVTMFIYSVLSGLFFGLYNAIICLSISDCVGASNIAKAFGFLGLLQGCTLSLGPPIAGLLRDTTGTFKLPLIVAGCSEILGALICFPSVRAKKGEQDCTPACEDESAVA